ncbi:chloride channel protein [Erwinia sp. S63]|uniref:chloride channel protein n=1 Tax=Erwinia sp. S63 TaxID=2769341 RepID=UPI00190D93B2|nr:chloride channel protein [Erwinia sp. S63]MBK0097376.1 chloride channel protein [Erwinia sp. S63]
MNKDLPVTQPLRWALALIFTGIIAGICGMLLALLLHFIQHIAFGYSLDAVISNESFLSGVTAATDWRRFSAILCGGLVAGWGWWLLGRYGSQRVSVSQAVNHPNKPMPLVTTAIHALLQIITVALGSPLGREVAPREAGALGAGLIANVLGLDADARKVLIACGAGAGLAAVYNVPLAGALFTLEMLLVTFRWECAVAALITSAIAAGVATLGLGNEVQYHFLVGAAPASIIAWAIICGPILGAAAMLFRKLTQRARSKVKNSLQIPLFCLLSFALLGGLSVVFPQLPGNGKGPMQLALDGAMPMALFISLVILKMLVILAVLRSGAEGGLLTPGLTIGALFSLILCAVWQHLVPVGHSGSFALIGATAFLAASMQMPLTAVALLLEFTGMDHSYLVPAILCTSGSFLMCRWLEKAKV